MKNRKQNPILKSKIAILSMLISLLKINKYEIPIVNTEISDKPIIKFPMIFIILFFLYLF